MVQSTPRRSIQQLRQHDFDHPQLNSGYQIMTIPLSPLSFRFDLIFIALTISRLPPSTDTHKPHPRRLQRYILLYAENMGYTGCPVKLFPVSYLLFYRLLLMQIAKVGTILKNSGNLLHDRHKNFEN